ncbi:hypothetical protein Pmani_031979 [Petrolisthes manimaculis]|uniref:Uncharacterized protein n=1 Tax=Petrolisthes manimaculis TaxID=1843537 RepID=A0AAE1TU89_9EUCA|nr:hypothetical protein Pmani_031979 [Petrolisthes manimaculis]
MRVSRWAVVATLAAILVLSEAGWLETFSEQLCGSNIRCYSKTYVCAQLLNVANIERSILGVLAYCRSLLGPSTLTQQQLTPNNIFEVLNGDHGEQLPECLLVQMGLINNGEVNQAGLYLALSYVPISVDLNKQNAFLDAISQCPQPSRSQLVNFGACVIQACVQST